MDNPSAILLAHSQDIVRLTSERLGAYASSGTLEATLDSFCRFIEENESIAPDLIRGLGDDDLAARRALYCLAWTALDTLKKELAPADYTHASGMIFKAIRGAIGLELLTSGAQRQWRTMFAGDGPASQSPTDVVIRAAHAFTDVLCVYSDAGQILWMNDPGLALLDYDAVTLRQGITIFDIVAPQFVGQCLGLLVDGSSPQPFDAVLYTNHLGRVAVRLYRERIGPDGQPAANLLVGRPVQEGAGARAAFDSILNHMPVGILLTDPGATITEANARACAVVGADRPADLLGRSFLDLLVGDREAPRAAIAATVDRGEELRLHCSSTTIFGKSLNCDMVMAPLRDANAAIGGLEIFLVDVSEQTSLHRSLVQAEKLSALGEIAAGVAHELNNPLTGILGYAQLLMESGLDEKIRGRLDQISLEAQRCRAIVQGLLRFARHYESAQSPDDVNPIIAEVLSLRAYQMRVDKIETTISLGEDIPLVELDRTEIQRVFLNIVNNAHYALCRVDNRPRRFAVTTSARGGEVTISFEDSGPGMPPDVQAKVFDPFFTTKDIGEGTGMGLSIAYGVVRDHGGRILVESTVNHGTTFTVVLPAAANIAG